jgi:Gluconate 2-dehydrogenase subunit 3
MSLQPDVAGPRAEAAVAPPSPPRAAPAVLAVAERALLRAILNHIVPASENMPGAGDLEVVGSIERTLADSPRLRRLFLDGLRDIAIASRGDFVSLAPTVQTEILQRIEQSQPAFFTALVEHTYRGYYTHPLVQQALNARAPQPIGYELPPFDPSLLDKQRQRPPFWRPAG